MAYMTLNLKAVVNGMAEALLWCEVDDDGTPLDDLGAELAPSTLTYLLDCAVAFSRALSPLLTEHTLRLLTEAQIGHNLWLTAREHGTGFWDRGLGGLGDLLARLAVEYGPRADVYIGDDGLVYVDHAAALGAAIQSALWIEGE